MNLPLNVFPVVPQEWLERTPGLETFWGRYKKSIQERLKDMRAEAKVRRVFSCSYTKPGIYFLISLFNSAIMTLFPNSLHFLWQGPLYLYSFTSRRLNCWSYNNSQHFSAFIHEFFLPPPPPDQCCSVMSNVGLWCPIFGKAVWGISWRVTNDSYGTVKRTLKSWGTNTSDFTTFQK